ncbi:MAG: ABC transporter permease [SAR324 cluster bacterium]|nr:ABC transporter permease [SAR324 cluster bacterium]
MKRSLHWLRWLFPAILLLPLLAGVFGTFLSSFNLFFFQKNLDILESWTRLWEHPSTWPALWLSLRTAVIATLLSLLGSGMILSMWQSNFLRYWLGRWLILPVALPHATAAIILILLLAPSGWLWRLFATSNSLPPEFPFPHDTAGWALVFGLVSKELPFLLLIQLNVCRQLPEATRVKTAQLLGQPPWLGWWLTVFPSLYQQIRLPLWAVLAFSFSVIDMALILGPTAPPTFSVLILQWSTDPMLEQQALAAAGSLLQGMVLLILLLCWWVVEQVIRVLPQIPTRMWSLHKIGFLLNQIAWSLIVSGIVLLCGGMTCLLLWSFARRWPFPAGLPTEWTLLTWERNSAELIPLLATTAGLGVAAAAIGLLLVMIWLYFQHSPNCDRSLVEESWVYLPLILPQLTFLFGIQILANFLRLEGTVLLVLWMHLVYVLPYTLLLLAGSWRTNQLRFRRVGQILGQSAWRILWSVQLPMLRPLILLTMAIGFSVSLAQYLPTTVAGAGRWSTLTTEAVSLASGQDRRLLSLLGIWQSFLPALALSLAWLLRGPAWQKNF